MRITAHGNLFTIQDLADATGKSYATVWGRIYHSYSLPEPSVKVGRRRLYSEEQYQRIIDLITRQG